MRSAYAFTVSRFCLWARSNTTYAYRVRATLDAMTSPRGNTPSESARSTTCSTSASFGEDHTSSPALHVISATAELVPGGAARSLKLLGKEIRLKRPSSGRGKYTQLKSFR